MIGFEIGGTKCAVCIGSYENGHIVIQQKKKIPTDLSVSPYEMLDRLCHEAERMTDCFDTIGISCGGPLDTNKGFILSPPNLLGWDEVPITDYLNTRYGCPVYLENDANACALAEWKYGAGHGLSHMIFLTFGTGMGAGIILNGALYQGANGNAGEVGHVRMKKNGPIGYGKHGSFEGFASGGGIAQQARAMAKRALRNGAPVGFCPNKESLSSVTAETVAMAARNGDPDAKEIYRSCGTMLGYGLAALIDVFNPEAIVLGSIYVRASDLLEAPMRQVLEEECLPSSLASIRILPAALGESLGDYAALAVADQEKR